MRTVRLGLAFVVLAATAALSADEPADLLPNGVAVGDGLLAGGLPSREQLAALRDAGYRTVVDLRTEGEPGGGRLEVEALGLRYVPLPIDGAAGLTEENARAFGAILDEVERPAVVHCASGNRVGALFALAAFHDGGASASEALDRGLAAGLTRLEPAVRQYLASAELSAAALLERSIAYHDPDGAWAEGAYRLEISESRPDGTERETVVVIDGSGGAFGYRGERLGRRIEAEIVGEACAVTLDGSSEVSAAEVETYGLGCERMLRVRDYYTYLWGLPMKLRDGGTVLDPEVATTTFADRPVDALRVSYEEGVGSDVWYFYLDRATHALVGYRFYHDESAGDGEYIVLEGETAAAGLRLPRRRTWYTNAEDELLGTDELVAIERLD